MIFIVSYGLMNPPAPLKSIDKHGHVLYVGSLSKTLSPGLRIDGLFT